MVTYGYYAATADLNHVTQWDSGSSYVTAYTYNGYGKRITMEKPSGREWRYEYNKRGQLTKIIDKEIADDNVTVYTYDEVGNRTQVSENAEKTNS